ncbi:ABC transporter ATP-binding protein [Isoptericola sediminis]|uniref:ATP-binding cassette domain-containing protein n=1 Tax=Isoptericola sediminis TaxID=2733572 RepID=A0A849JT95_9MICO|nr:ATP-binding cassette domain-containing protein [Isoptericola sediminis]NNU26512.1 ATP-binding cassette domain-containing protein [Isoptericola sediminis]
MTTLVHADGVTKRFGAFAAVEDMSLDVHPGEIVGLLGSNGAGKTTLLRVLLGLEAADVGHVEVFGDPPADADRHALGYVPQGLGLSQALSVRQNVDFVAAAFSVRHAPALPTTLAAVADQPVGRIGLGRQRQLAFYCALLHSPRLLVLDEPTSGVDPLARARLWDTIHAQAEAGAGVLVTTHYMQEAEQCDRLVIMSRGRGVARGAVGDITATSRTAVVHTEEWSAAFAALDEAGLPVTLAGRTSRVAGTAPERVRAALDADGVPADVEEEAATLEETMVLIEQSSRHPGPR